MATDGAIGKLRELVTLQRATMTRGSFGEETPAWTTVATLRARVTPRDRGTGEQMLADRPVMLAAFDVELRKSVTVSHLDRLLWRGLTLSVEVVTPIPERERVLLRCVAMDSSG